LAALAVRTEADLDPMELFHLRVQDGLNEWDFQVGSGAGAPDDVAESLHDSFFVWRHDKSALPDEDKGGNGEKEGTRAAERQPKLA